MMPLRMCACARVQTYMPFVPWLYCAGYSYISLWPKGALPVWNNGAGPSDFIYTVLMCAPAEQVGQTPPNEQTS